MNSQDLKKFTLPDTPGIYFFKKGKNILYIGKATSLRDRVKSYMSKTVFDTRGPLIAKMLEEVENIEFIETDSVLEALMLEASKIKKHQPFYNSKEKDDKSYNYVTITEEDFPKVLVTRGSGTYGPFPHGGELKEALKIIRKIFPYRDSKCKLNNRLCFNAQIGLCPGPCAGRISKNDYRKIIHHLRLFFEAKKPRLIKSLEKEMKTLAKEHKFEDAEKVKRQIFALEHIQDIALIKKDIERMTGNSFRIEAYDVAHISGTNVVGVMTVIEDGELAKSQYRKFKIRDDKNNDTANLKEVLTRRLAHPEWRLPNLVVVDGGKGQINVAKEVLEKAGLDINVAAVVKDERHKAREIMGDTKHSREILLANSEAHRFAINYHRKLRGKGFRI
ncbi:MAG: UvrB/UvrC motif-containing protein [bacterium]|nr:UvrB/UvrC motif-containing protein [bacterium]